MFANAHLLSLRTSVATLLALLGSCSSLDVADRAEGWRNASVVNLGRAADLAPKVNHDCATGAAPDAPYLIVRYRDHGVHTSSLGTSEVAPNADFHAGEKVLVNLKNCTVRRPS